MNPSYNQENLYSRGWNICQFKILIYAFNLTVVAMIGGKVAMIILANGALIVYRNHAI